jgi:hypothetical protein
MILLIRDNLNACFAVENQPTSELFQVAEFDDGVIFRLSFRLCIIKTPVIEYHINIGEGLVFPGETKIVVAEVVF